MHRVRAKADTTGMRHKNRSIQIRRKHFVEEKNQRIFVLCMILVGVIAFIPDECARIKSKKNRRAIEKLSAAKQPSSIRSFFFSYGRILLLFARLEESSWKSRVNVCYIILPCFLSRVTKYPSFT